MIDLDDDKARCVKCGKLVVLHVKYQSARHDDESDERWYSIEPHNCDASPLPSADGGRDSDLFLQWLESAYLRATDSQKYNDGDQYAIGERDAIIRIKAEYERQSRPRVGK